MSASSRVRASRHLCISQLHFTPFLLRHRRHLGQQIRSSNRRPSPAWARRRPRNRGSRGSPRPARPGNCTGPCGPSSSQNRLPSVRTPQGGRIAQGDGLQPVAAVHVRAVALGVGGAGQHVGRPLGKRRGEQVLHDQQLQAARTAGPWARRSTAPCSRRNPHAAELGPRSNSGEELVERQSRRGRSGR